MSKGNVAVHGSGKPLEEREMRVCFRIVGLLCCKEKVQGPCTLTRARRKALRDYRNPFTVCTQVLVGARPGAEEWLCPFLLPAFSIPGVYL